jgi:cell division initiation protein
VIGAVDRVRRADFPVVLRGYDRSAVDAYVAEVAQLVAELEATQLPQAAVQRALDEVGEETSEILKRAHTAAEEVTSRSRSEAAARLASAERDADLIRRDADDQIRTLDDDVRAIWHERQRLIEDLRQLAEDVLALSDDALDRAAPPAVAGDEADEAAILPDEEEQPADDLPEDEPATIEQARDEPRATQQPPGQGGP